MKNWEDDDDSEYCSIAPGLRRRRGGRRRARHRDRGRSTSPPTTRTACSPTSCASTRPAARPTPTCCATPRSSSRPSSTTRCAWAPRRSPPGHYARVRERAGSFRAAQGLDPLKDQSYFLHRLNQAQLSQDAVPGGRTSARPRCASIAAEIGLPNAKKKDSTGICFIGERPVPRVPEPLPAEQAGPDRWTTRAARIGEHMGLSFYTLGQRKGIGIGGRKRRRRGEPWFVAAQGYGERTRSTWCRATTTRGCCRTALDGRRHELGGRRMRPPGGALAGARPATARPMPRARSAPGAGDAFALDFAAAAVGGDARAVGGAVRRRGVPGWCRSPAPRRARRPRFSAAWRVPSSSRCHRWIRRTWGQLRPSWVTVALMRLAQCPGLACQPPITLAMVRWPAAMFSATELHL